MTTFGWIGSLFFKQEMELSLIGLQNAGKTSLVNVIAVWLILPSLRHLEYSVFLFPRSLLTCSVLASTAQTGGYSEDMIPTVRVYPFSYKQYLSSF